MYVVECVCRCVHVCIYVGGVCMCVCHSWLFLETLKFVN